MEAINEILKQDAVKLIASLVENPNVANISKAESFIESNIEPVNEYLYEGMSKKEIAKAFIKIISLNFDL